jgi:hypothetical protein
VCGPLPADVVTLDALAAEAARLDGLTQLPIEAAATLREQGVFTRIWVDTLENLVGVVESLAARCSTPQPLTPRNASRACGVP